MSYCRFSSDNWESGAYVYEDASGGWTVHLAGRKRIPTEGKPPMPKHPEVTDWQDESQTKAFFEAHAAQMAWMDDESNFTWQNIDSPKAGESFYGFETPGDCADFLEECKTEGFNVPQYAIDALREEQTEINQGNA